MTVPVLKDVNFSMEEGEYVAIMGCLRFWQIHTDEYYRLSGSGNQGNLFPGWSKTSANALRMRCQISV